MLTDLQVPVSPFVWLTDAKSSRQDLLRLDLLILSRFYIIISGLLLCLPGIANVAHVHVPFSKSLQIRSKQISFIIPRFVTHQKHRWSPEPFIVEKVLLRRGLLYESLPVDKVQSALADIHLLYSTQTLLAVFQHIHHSDCVVEI